MQQPAARQAPNTASFEEQKHIMFRNPFLEDSVSHKVEYGLFKQLTLGNSRPAKPGVRPKILPLVQSKCSILLIESICDQSGSAKNGRTQELSADLQSTKKQQWRSSHSASYNQQIATGNSWFHLCVAASEVFDAKNGLGSVQTEWRLVHLLRNQTLPYAMISMNRRG